jgi:hypothetical protein
MIEELKERDQSLCHDSQNPWKTYPELSEVSVIMNSIVERAQITRKMIESDGNRS